MTTTSVLWRKLWRLAQALHRDCEGQDFVEYALITGFICTVVITMSPAVSGSFVTIMSKVNSCMIASSGG